MAVKVNKNKCNGCGRCEEICPVNAIKMEQNIAVISNDCIECGACLSVCPEDAISV